MAFCLHLICALLATAATALRSVEANDDDPCLVENIPVQENFDLDRYLGKWYEIKWIRDNWSPPEESFKDFVNTYERYNSTTMIAYWAGRDPNGSIMEDCFTGTITFFTTDTPGKFIYSYEFPDNIVKEITYWIVLTDYDNYALVWGCQEIQNGRCTKPDSWVRSRRRTLSAPHRQLVDQKITEICLNLDDFYPTQQRRECYPGTK